MVDLIIIGAGGHGRVVSEIAAKCDYSVLFWDDFLVYDSRLHLFKVTKRSLKLPKDTKLFLGIGDNKMRKSISSQYLRINYVSLHHNKSILSENTCIGVGTVLMAGVSINTNVTIGDHCILNTNSSVDHDCIIHDFVHISPGATLCGNVNVSVGTHIGAGAVILPNINIGKWCVIGAGAVVIKDIPDYSLVVGVPGRIVKKQEIYE